MAQQTCRDLQADIAGLNGGKKGFDLNNLTPAGWIGQLGDAFGSKNNSQTFNTNINNTSISTTDITNIFNSCSNSSQLIQTNDLTQSPECIETISKACENTKDKLLCMREMSTVRDIEQTNTKTIKQNCIINNLLKTISSKDVSMENAAQLDVLQKTGGLMTSNTSVTSNCNQVNNNISTNTFLNAITKCANEYSIQQINKINACGSLSNVKQRSSSDFFSECYAGQGIFKEDIVKVKSFNKALLSTKQKADTSMVSIGSSILIIVILIVGVFVFIMIKKKKAQSVQQ